MTLMLGHRVRTGGRAIRWSCQRSLAMVKPPVMLVGSLFLNMVMVFGCASGFVDPASTFPAGLS